MKKKGYVLFWGAWVAYMLASFFLFPVFNTNTLIISIVIIGFGCWVYNKTYSLKSLLFMFPYHYVFFEYYGDQVEVYQTAFIGTLVVIAIVYLVDTFKKQHLETQAVTVALDGKVAQRSREIRQLIEQLIDSDELHRRSLGQDIHDGIGQNLTGLLLYSSSLQTRLGQIDPILADRISPIISGARRTLDLARKVSRTLLPYKTVESGLAAALDELASYFNETHNLSIDIQLDGSEKPLPERTLIQLYRIVYECILNSVHHDSPQGLLVMFSTVSDFYQLETSIHGCKDSSVLRSNMFVELMRYRARLIDGNLEVVSPSGQEITFKCFIPIKQASPTTEE